jgi:hypothetical protein
MYAYAVNAYFLILEMIYWLITTEESTRLLLSPSFHTVS